LLIDPATTNQLGIGLGFRALLRWQQVGRQGRTRASIATIDWFRPKNCAFSHAPAATAIAGNQQNARATGAERLLCSFKGTDLSRRSRL